MDLEKTCSKCGRVMLLRMNRRTGRQFWSCTGWPDHCGETENYVQDGKTKASTKAYMPPVSNIRKSLSMTQIEAIIRTIFTGLEPIASTVYVVLSILGVSRKDVEECANCGLNVTMRDAVLAEYGVDAPVPAACTPDHGPMNDDDLPF